MNELLNCQELAKALGERMLSALYQRGYEFQYPPLSQTTLEHALKFAAATLEILRKEWVDERRARHSMAARLRRDVFERDHGICHYCGSKDEPTIDHVVPVSKGGQDVLENLVTACFSCNIRKRTMSYEQFKPLAKDREPVRGARPGRGKLQKQHFTREDMQALLATLGG